MSPIHRTTLTLTALCALLLFVCSAPGQTPADKAAAQVAFDKALALLEQGNAAEACPLFEDSQRLDPAMGTQYQLAQCYEKSGRLASAWANYTAVADAAKAANMADREQWARERVGALAPRLSKLTIVVPAAVAALDGLSIQRDGGTVPRSLWGEAIPVDGGTHRVAARAPGHAPWDQEISVAPEKDAARIEVPLLQPTSPAASAAQGAPAPAPTEQPTSDGADGDDGSAQTVAGIVVAAVGVAAMGAGVVVGLVAKSDYDDSAEQHCGEEFCDQAGIDAAEDARGLGNVATGFFIGGGAVLVAGLITWLTAPSGAEQDRATAAATRGPRIELVAGPGHAGLGVRARW